MFFKNVLCIYQKNGIKHTQQHLLSRQGGYPYSVQGTPILSEEEVPLYWSIATSPPPIPPERPRTGPVTGPQGTPRQDLKQDFGQDQWQDHRVPPRKDLGPETREGTWDQRPWGNPLLKDKHL